jgi:hypothetical protein
MSRDGKHYWLTPPDLYLKLDQEFHFDFDPCPYPRPDGFDGLSAEWGKSNYVNPLFVAGKGQGPTAWARKAITEYEKGNKIVMVFPLDKWILRLIDAGAELRNLKQVYWRSIEDPSAEAEMGRWIACFVLDPTKQDG